MSSSQIGDEAKAAYGHAKNATLGEIPSSEVDEWIRDAIGDADPWILIGGPPCQAYSLAGRSRMRGVDPKAFEEDKRHFLYKEYLRIIRDFGPSVFVMENVKGILSSTHGGSRIFEQILSDLSDPGNGLQYEIRSFATGGVGSAASHRDYILESEKFGIPQMRHRVILFGVRRDIANHEHRPLSINSDHSNTVANALSGLPKLRGRISRETDSQDAWLSALKEASRQLTGWKTKARDLVEARMRDAYQKAFSRVSTGGSYIPGIRDVLYRYCRAVDRGDADLLKSCYHPDGRDDHGFYSGLGSDFADYVIPILAQLELSIHSLSNPLIELDGDRAYVETHWSVIHRLKRGGKLTDIWDQGRYIDEFECRDGEWKILNRLAVMDAERWSDTLNFLALVPDTDPHKVRTGRRGMDDPVYRRRELGNLIRSDFRLPDLWGIYRRLLGTPRFLIRFLVTYVLRK